jgi:hypothetical protein
VYLYYLPKLTPLTQTTLQTAAHFSEESATTRDWRSNRGSNAGSSQISECSHVLTHTTAKRIALPVAACHTCIIYIPPIRRFLVMCRNTQFSSVQEYQQVADALRDQLVWARDTLPNELHPARREAGIGHAHAACSSSAYGAVA